MIFPDEYQLNHDCCLGRIQGDECDKINSQRLQRIIGPVCMYEADDSDNHGNGLRAADHQRIQQHCERLPDKLQLKMELE